MTSGSYYQDTQQQAMRGAAHNMGHTAGMEAAEADYRQGTIGAHRGYGAAGPFAEDANRAFFDSYDSRIRFRLEQAKPREPFTLGSFMTAALCFLIPTGLMVFFFYNAFYDLFH